MLPFICSQQGAVDSMKCSNDVFFPMKYCFLNVDLETCATVELVLLLQ